MSQRFDPCSRSMRASTGPYFTPSMVTPARNDREQGSNLWLTLSLREGKNRGVKRLAEHLGLTVNRLIRISFGPFALGDLAEGAVEEVKRRVLADQLGPKLAREFGLKA